MIGIILWYNPDKQVGLVWCEDQGPLAYIGPEIPIPTGDNSLACGDQVHFVHEVREKVRYVTGIDKVERHVGTTDPQTVLAAYHDQSAARELRIVA